MTRYSVSNKWEYGSDSLAEFEATLRELDNATKTEKMKLSSITFYSHNGVIETIKDKSGNEIKGIKCYISKIGELTPNFDKFTKLYFLSVESLKNFGFNDEALDEFLEAKSFISINDKYYAIDNNNFSKTFAMQIDSGCEAILEASLARDRWFAACAEKRKKKTVTFVSRIDDKGVHKMFAGFSAHYCAVPQQFLISIIEKFEKNGTRCEFKNFVANQHITQAIYTLPDIQGDINKQYNLPIDLIPALVLQTSDTGYSSLKVWGGFIRDGKIICKNKDCASRKHSGEIKDLTDEIHNKIEKKVFSSYFELPKKMLEAFSVPIEKDEIVPFVIRTLVKELGLIKPIGIKRWYGGKSLKESESDILLDILSDELKGNCYCLYDIMSEMLNLPKMLESEIERDALNDVQEKLFNFAFLDFEKIMKDAEKAYSEAT